MLSRKSWVLQDAPPPPTSAHQGSPSRPEGGGGGLEKWLKRSPTPPLPPHTSQSSPTLAVGLVSLTDAIPVPGALPALLWRTASGSSLKVCVDVSSRSAAHIVAIAPDIRPVEGSQTGFWVKIEHILLFGSTSSSDCSEVTVCSAWAPSCACVDFVLGFRADLCPSQ